MLIIEKKQCCLLEKSIFRKHCSLYKCDENFDFSTTQKLCDFVKCLVFHKTHVALRPVGKNHVLTCRR